MSPKGVARKTSAPEWPRNIPARRHDRRGQAETTSSRPPHPPATPSRRWRSIRRGDERGLREEEQDPARNTRPEVDERRQRGRVKISLEVVGRCESDEDRDDDRERCAGVEAIVPPDPMDRWCGHGTRASERGGLSRLDAHTDAVVHVQTRIAGERLDFGAKSRRRRRHELLQQLVGRTCRCTMSGREPSSANVQGLASGPASRSRRLITVTPDTADRWPSYRPGFLSFSR